MLVCLSTSFSNFDLSERISSISSTFRLSASSSTYSSSLIAVVATSSLYSYSTKALEILTALGYSFSYFYSSFLSVYWVYAVYAVNAVCECNNYDFYERFNSSDTFVTASLHLSD